MAVSWDEWEVPTQGQPRAEDYAFDLDRTLASVVALKSIVPDDAFTAETLGTERAGHGVQIADNGLILTIGYLIVEAETAGIPALVLGSSRWRSPSALWPLRKGRRPD